MQGVQKYKPIDGCNMDVADKYLKASESRYLLNADLVGRDSNDGVTTPHHANIQVPYVQPAGENTTIGKHYSKRTRELYCFVHNTLGNHHIYRINANGLSTTMILQDSGLGFVIDRANRINLRAHLYFNNNNFLGSRGNKLAYKYLVWTNGAVWQGFLDVETSIATNGFRTPYYATSDRSIYYQLPPRPSLRCPEVGWLAGLDRTKVNVMMYAPWQFRIKGIYTDGRETAWSPISESIFHEKSACESEENYERCVRITYDAINPLVEKWVLAYRNCSGNFTDNQNPDWYIFDYVDRWAQPLTADTPFYERTINPSIAFDADANTFQYVFCGDKLCIPVDKQETDRNYNDIPITSFGLFPLDDRLGLANNEYEYEPVDPSELKKVAFTVETDPASLCKLEYATVKVAILIHNHFVSLNQWIYYMEDDDNYKTHNLFYGGVGYNGDFRGGDTLYKQHFTEKDTGFIIYVDGSPYYAKTRQFKAHYGGAIVKDDDYPKNFNAPNHRADVLSDNIDDSFYYVSIAEIKVPKGTSGFVRVASAQATPNMDYPATSTNIYGILLNRAAYATRWELTDENSDRKVKEMFFSTCSGDVDLTNTPFIVADLTAPTSDLQFGPNGSEGNIQVRRETAAFTGYVRTEQKVDGVVVNTDPIERAEVEGEGGGNRTITSTLTDHNGYYFASFSYQLASGFSNFNTLPGVNIFGALNCARTQLAFYDSPDHIWQQRDKDIPVTGDYYLSNYQAVRILVNDTNFNPVSGIMVAGEGAKAARTGVDGYATVIIRNAAAKNLRFIPMQSGTCPLILEGCNFCVPVILLMMPSCLVGDPPIDYRNLPKFQPNKIMKGLMPSGTYPVAIKFMDDAGRETDAEGDWQMFMPSVVSMGNFSFSNIRYTITTPLTLPPWIAKMALMIGKNRNQEDAVSWVVDKVTFVDGAGNEATAFAADRVKLSIKSLYDVQQKLTNLNVKYQFLKGDRVRFLVNGDGNIFTDFIDAYIESDENNRAEYAAQTTTEKLEKTLEPYSNLIVSYRKELSGLTKGAVIQIYTPRVCDNQDYFYETCQLIDVRNMAYPYTGTVRAYDTYLIRRSIAYDDKANFFAFPFLHHSPSDFWGDHCISRGRMSVKNPYQKKVKLGRNIAMSLPFFTNGNVNGLGTFLSQFQKNFTGEQRGDIIAVISMEQHMIFILQHDNFVSSAGDDFVKLDQDNRLRANAGEMTITDANSRISGNFGCRYEDVSGIIAGDGWVFWLDAANKAPVLHDFQQATDIAKGKMETYFNNKLVTDSEIIAGYDPSRERVLLTFRKSNTVFVVNHHEVVYEENETLLIGLRGKEASFEFVSGTPECYGYHLDYQGEQVLFSFKNAIPYVHKRVANVLFNTYFEVPCDQVLDFIVNEFTDKIKIPVAMQLQSSVPYFAEKITTSQGQESRIVPARSRKVTERKHDMEFLCDELSKGGLYNGNSLRGYTIRIRLVRDNTIGVRINTVDPLKQQAYSELDSVLIKYLYSEQSSYNKK